MTAMLQARVDDQLADAARQRASDQGVSLSRYLTDLLRRDLAQAEEDAFWRPFSPTTRTLDTSPGLRPRRSKRRLVRRLGKVDDLTTLPVERAPTRLLGLVRVG